MTLPNDLRHVLVRLRLNKALTDGQEATDSFAAAIVRATKPERLRGFRDIGCTTENSLRYGGYITAKNFTPVTFSASDVLKGEPLTLNALAGKIVIIGGDWHSRAFGRGPRIDAYQTPVGEVAGVLIHANYV